MNSKPLLIKRLFLCLSKQKTLERGFTLIELVIVFIIIGILSAIALPSFLNQAAKAKQSEGKMYIGAINRAQQAFRMENNQFATTLEDLQVGIGVTTSNYQYILDIPDPSLGTIMAEPLDSETVKGYSGAVWVNGIGLTTSRSCQTINVNAVSPVEVPVIDSNSLLCQGNMQLME
jgi:type IV pilus assembly protein PilA